jgi:uncharacterized protein
MGVLRAVREVSPPNWLVGAGALRSVVWDRLHGFETATPIRDVDVAYFDDGNLSPGRDDEITAELRARRPDVPWEVTNQAGVHLWYEAKFGYPIPRLRSVEEAVGMWPETATSVAVRLRQDDWLYVVAPCGVDDLLGLVLRHNTRQVRHEFFLQRLREKRIQETWPKVKIYQD